jgi:ATP synthase protein I
MGNGETDGPRKMRSFEQRLAKARGEAGLDRPEPAAAAKASPDAGASPGGARDAKAAARTPDNPLSLAMRLGVEMVAAMAIAVMFGWGVDWIFHTRPLFMIAFVPIGMAAGIRNLIRAAGPGRGKD